MIDKSEENRLCTMILHAAFNAALIDDVLIRSETMTDEEKIKIKMLTNRIMDVALESIKIIREG